MATGTRSTRSTRTAVPKPGPVAAPAAPVNGARAASKAIDFSALTVADAPALPGRNSATALDSTPVLAWLTDSWDARQSVERNGKASEQGKVKSVTVPKDQVAGISALLREAAIRLNCGVAVRPGEPDDAGNVMVAFRAQTRILGRGRPAGSKNKAK